MCAISHVPSVHTGGIITYVGKCEHFHTFLVTLTTSLTHIPDLRVHVLVLKSQKIPKNPKKSQKIPKIPKNPKSRTPFFRVVYPSGLTQNTGILKVWIQKLGINYSLLILICLVFYQFNYTYFDNYLDFHFCWIKFTEDVCKERTRTDKNLFIRSLSTHFTTDQN